MDLDFLGRIRVIPGSVGAEMIQGVELQRVERFAQRRELVRLRSRLLDGGGSGANGQVLPNAVLGKARSL